MTVLRQRLDDVRALAVAELAVQELTALAIEIRDRGD
jgi:hypothetical protein